MQWVSWMLVGPDEAQTERAQRNPDAYYSRFHAVSSGVGGWKGTSGKALCGVKVPADNPDIVHSWRNENEGGKRCSRCARLLEGM